MTDDEIRQMQKEIDKEKKQGLGLPTDVMSNVAQQQMMGDVDLEQQAKQMQMQQASDEQTAQQPEKKQQVQKTKPKPKNELPNKINYPDVQLEDEDTTFNKIKKLL